MQPVIVRISALLAFLTLSSVAGAEEKSPLSSAQITGAVQPALAGIKDCYTAATGRKPSLAGELDVSWVVQPNGTVSGPKVLASSTAREPEFETCVLGVVKNIKFPKPGKKVMVNYPFSFASKTIAPTTNAALSPDAQAARNTLFENKKSLLDCFGAEGKRDRDAKVHVTFRIFAGGYPGDITHDDQPSPDKKAIAECLVSRIHDMRFKSPESGNAGLTVPLSVTFLEQGTASK